MSVSDNITAVIFNTTTCKAHNNKHKQADTFQWKQTSLQQCLEERKNKTWEWTQDVCDQLKQKTHILNHLPTFFSAGFSSGASSSTAPRVVLTKMPPD